MFKNINYEKIYFWTIAIFALILPLSRAAVTFFSLLLPLIWIVEGDFKRKFTLIKESPALKVLLIFLFLLVISLFWTENFPDGRRNIRVMLTYLSLIYIVGTSLKTYYTDRILNFFLIGMFISEMLTYGIYLGWWSIYGATPSNPSPFMNHIEYSVFLAFTAILLLYRIFSDSYTMKQKMAFSIFFLTVTGNLFIANGRTGQIAFIAGLTLMVILHYRLTIKAFLIGVATFSLIFITAYNFITPFHNRVQGTIDNIKKIEQGKLDNSIGIRVAYYITTFNIVKHHPIFGVGVGDFELETAKEVAKHKYDYFTPHMRKFMGRNTPHNQYLLFLLQTGVVGLILFILYIYYFIRLPIKDREIKDRSLLFITIYIFSFIPETLLTHQFNLALFGLFGGIFIANSLVNQNSVKS